MKRPAYFLLLLFFALVGCVSTPIETEEYSPSLWITQNSDGKTTLVWESDSSYYYTIYYRNGSSEWREMRSVNRVRGTGGTMRAADRVDPHKPIRRYRLHFEKLGG